MIHCQPDGRITVLAFGLRMQEAHDKASALNRAADVVDPEDERMARYFEEPK